MLQPQKIAKKLLSPALYMSGAYARRWQRRAAITPTTVVLYYHRITDESESAANLFNIERGTSAKSFEAQIRLMLRHCTPIKPSEVLSTNCPSPLRFTVTFDDGYADNHRIAAPILKRLGVPAAFFVVSDYVGTDRRFWWEQLSAMLRATRRDQVIAQDLPTDLAQALSFPAILPLQSREQREFAHDLLSAAIRKLPHHSIRDHLQRLAAVLDTPVCTEGRDYPLMNWQDLQELHRQGFEIGGHTASHCNLGSANEDEIASEVTQSLIDTRNKLGEEIKTFAFPYGRVIHQSQKAVEALRSAGCCAAFATEKGVVTNDSPRFGLPRVALNTRWPFAWTYNVEQAFTSNPPPAPPQGIAAHEAP